MQYFTRDLWLGAQSTRLVSENERQWQRALDEYQTQLRLLLPRIGTDTFRFFSEADIHDSELLRLTVIDGSRPASLSELPRPWVSPTNFPVQVTLAVLSANDEQVWELNYSHVRRLLVDFPTEDPLFHNDGAGFGDWGYHELSDAGKGFLRHEVLFASGATLLFEFRDIAVKKAPRTAASG